MKLWNLISRVAVDTHRTLGLSCTSLKDGACMVLTHPRQWVRAMGETVSVDSRHLREKLDIRAFLWRCERDGLLGEDHGDAVVWTLWDDQTQKSTLGFGRIVAGPVANGAGFKIPEYEVQIA